MRNCEAVTEQVQKLKDEISEKNYALQQTIEKVAAQAEFALK